MGSQPWWATAFLIVVIGLCVAVADELAIFPRSWRGLGMGFCILCAFVACGMALYNLAG